MRIAQIILPTASEYERKSQRVDRAALSANHEVVVIPPEEVAASGAEVAHVYATGELPSALFRRFPIPYVASADVARSRWPFGQAVAPGYVVSPVIEKVEESRYQPLPEAVEDVYFSSQRAAGGSQEKRTVGSFARPAVRNMVEQTLARIHRFRDDVEWEVFDHVPAPEDLARVDVWVDPAVDDPDFDGFVAEALVVGLPVVATRTPINLARLEGGRTGFLIPPRDPNEMTHAILAGLFKREAAEGRQIAARQTASKFRARQRMRVLTAMYETLNP
jgi:glycosyl transferase family 1